MDLDLDLDLERERDLVLDLLLCVFFFFFSFSLSRSLPLSLSRSLAGPREAEEEEETAAGTEKVDAGASLVLGAGTSLDWYSVGRAGTLDINSRVAGAAMGMTSGCQSKRKGERE